MNDRNQMLGLPRLPGRLNTEQTAYILGFEPHDIAVLVRAKMLVPLGRPAPNAVKWFATKEVLEHAADPDWLHKATRKIYEYWARQNKKRRVTHGADETNRLLSA